MREILFRGKRVDNGEWVEGSLVNNIFFRAESNRPIPYIIDPYEYVEYDCMEDIGDLAVEVAPETVGQFTGRTDKNSKRVFEGDILCADTGRRWSNGICTDYTQYVVVVYNSQKARFEILGKLGESHKALDQVIDKRRATVAGNIHDNPELLK